MIMITMMKIYIQSIEQTKDSQRCNFTLMKCVWLLLIVEMLIIVYRNDNCMEEVKEIVKHRGTLHE